MKKKKWEKIMQEYTRKKKTVQEVKNYTQALNKRSKVCLYWEKSL